MKLFNDSNLSVRLEWFGKAISDKIAAQWKADGMTYNTPSRVMVESVGSRYIKLGRFEQIPHLTGPFKCTSVYCFVDRTNGDLLKGAWKAPVKNGVRGNLNDADADLMKKFTVYGPAYLR